jgi:hypothetical protein
LVEQRWPLAPIIFEFSHDANTPQALRRAHDFAREMHASFIHDNLDGEGQHNLIEEILATIGYRLVLREITYTSELHPGETLSVEMVWENTGVAPPYFESYPLVISLTNPKGKSFVDYQLEPNLRTWLPGHPINLAGEIELPANLAPGDYGLRLAFIDSTTRQPILALAIVGRDEQGRYLIGPVAVAAR